MAHRKPLDKETITRSSMLKYGVRICMSCGREFEPLKVWQVTCSDECHDKRKRALKAISARRRRVFRKEGRAETNRRLELLDSLLQSLQRDFTKLAEFVAANCFDKVPALAEIKWENPEIPDFWKNALDSVSQVSVREECEIDTTAAKTRDEVESANFETTKLPEEAIEAASEANTDAFNGKAEEPGEQMAECAHANDDMEEMERQEPSGLKAEESEKNQESSIASEKERDGADAEHKNKIADAPKSESAADSLTADEISEGSGNAVENKTATATGQSKEQALSEKPDAGAASRIIDADEFIKALIGPKCKKESGKTGGKRDKGKNKDKGDKHDQAQKKDSSKDAPGCPSTAYCPRMKVSAMKLPCGTREECFMGIPCVMLPEGVTRLQSKCPVCEKLFDASRTNQRYCSRECATIAAQS